MKLSRNFKVLPPTSWTTSRRAVALKNLSKFRKAIDSLIHVDQDDDDDDDDDDNGNDNDNYDHHPTTITTLTLRVAMTINLMEICIFVSFSHFLDFAEFLGNPYDISTAPLRGLPRMSSKIESIEVRMQRIIKDAAMDVEDLQQVPSGGCRGVFSLTSRKKTKITSENQPF